MRVTLVGQQLELPAVGLQDQAARFGPLFGAPSGILGLDAPEGELLAPGLAAAASTASADAAFAAAAAFLRGRDLV